MNYWIQPANPKTYRHIDAFEKWGYIDWVQKTDFRLEISYTYTMQNPVARLYVKQLLSK